MSSPKPVPSKPLTFTPPVFLKGETKSSELLTVDGAEPNVISKKKPKKFEKKQNRRADGFREANKVLAAGLPEAKVTGKLQGAQANVSVIDELMETFEEAKKEEKSAAKKPFVLNPHLTQRPFHDDRLMQLKNRLQRPSFKNR